MYPQVNYKHLVDFKKLYKMRRFYRIQNLSKIPILFQLLKYNLVLIMPSLKPLHRMKGRWVEEESYFHTVKGTKLEGNPK